MRFIVALLLMTDVAMAQVENRIYHDAIGRNTGRSVTDSRGNVTYYDAMGRTTGRSTTNGNTTTVYDQMGRQTGNITTKPQGR
jgi:YD repeat-containing protein